MAPMRYTLMDWLERRELFTIELRLVLFESADLVYDVKHWISGSPKVNPQIQRVGGGLETIAF